MLSQILLLVSSVEIHFSSSRQWRPQISVSVGRYRIPRDRLLVRPISKLVLMRSLFRSSSRLVLLLSVILSEQKNTSISVMTWSSSVPWRVMAILLFVIASMLLVWSIDVRRWVGNRIEYIRNELFGMSYSEWASKFSNKTLSYSLFFCRYVLVWEYDSDIPSHLSLSFRVFYLFRNLCEYDLHAGSFYHDDGIEW